MKWEISCPVLIMGFSLLSALAREKKSTCYAGGDKKLYEKTPFRYNRVVQSLLQERKGVYMANKSNDLAHTKWMCKYHIVFTPKYRRKVIYNQLKEDIRDVLKQLCAYKGVEILEGKRSIFQR